VVCSCCQMSVLQLPPASELDESYINQWQKPTKFNSLFKTATEAASGRSGSLKASLPGPCLGATAGAAAASQARVATQGYWQLGTPGGPPPHKRVPTVPRSAHMKDSSPMPESSDFAERKREAMQVHACECQLSHVRLARSEPQRAGCDRVWT
jgi:hypothetical protein